MQQIERAILHLPPRGLRLEQPANAGGHRGALGHGQIRDAHGVKVGHRRKRANDLLDATRPLRMLQTIDEGLLAARDEHAPECPAPDPLGRQPALRGMGNVPDIMEGERSFGNIRPETALEPDVMGHAVRLQGGMV